MAISTARNRAVIASSASESVAQSQRVSGEIARAPRANRIVRAAFILFAGSLPFDMFSVVGETFALTKIIGFLFLAAALLQPRVTLRRPPAAFWWFFAYLMVAFLMGLPLTVNYASAVLGRLTTVAQLLCMMWVTANVMRDEEAAVLGLRAFVVGCVTIAVLMMLGVGRTTVLTSHGARLSFGGANANALGATLALGLLMHMGMAFTSRFSSRFGQWTSPVVVLVLLYAIASTGSRGAVVGIAGGLLTLAFQGETLARRFRNLALFVVLGTVLYYTVYTVFISRARWEEAVAAGRLAGRERIYPAALALIRERPILGWGPEGNTRELAKRAPTTEERRESLDPHDLYLYILTETGVVGMVPFLAGVGVCFALARRASRTRHGMLPIMLLVAVMAAALTSNWIRRKPLWFVFGYAVAAGTSASRRRRTVARQNVTRHLPSAQGRPAIPAPDGLTASS